MAILKRGEKWVGPFSVRDLLKHALDDDRPRPPETESAYLVTHKSWDRNPSRSTIPLYVGGNTGAGGRFWTRVGDLIADAFGFFSEKNRKMGHSSGGRSLNRYCCENNLHPQRLYIAWVEGAKCHRCLEARLHRMLKPELNKRRPPSCEKHGKHVDKIARIRRRLRRSRDFRRGRLG